jgi:hypothetical protein
MTLCCLLGWWRHPPLWYHHSWWREFPARQASYSRCRKIEMWKNEICVEVAFVSVVTRLWALFFWSIPGRGKRIFPLTSVCRPALVSTQPPVQLSRGGGGHFLGGTARPGRDADYSHLVPRSWKSRSYISSPPVRHHRCVVGLLLLLLLLQRMSRPVR